MIVVDPCFRDPGSEVPVPSPRSRVPGLGGSRVAGCGLRGMVGIFSFCQVLCVSVYNSIGYLVPCTVACIMEKRSRLYSVLSTLSIQKFNLKPNVTKSDRFVCTLELPEAGRQMPGNRDNDCSRS